MIKETTQDADSILLLYSNQALVARITTRESPVVEADGDDEIRKSRPWNDVMFISLAPSLAYVHN